jgi:GNAT superfamily N-acetyltransferase
VGGLSEYLTTGWEPELPVRDSMLRQFVFSYADRTAWMAGALGGGVDRDDDAALADLGSAFLFDNAVVLLRPPTPQRLAAVLDRAKAFYPADRAWVLMSVWPLPDQDATFVERGLTLMGHPPLMVRPPGGTPYAPPPELRVLPVSTPMDLSVFRQVLADGYPLSIDETSAIADPRLLGGDIHLFLGYAGNAPVATSGAAIHHGLLEVDWVATLPEARRRGYGAAMTWRAVRVAPDLPAVLIASDPGQPVYERMGFMRLLRATVWARFTL